MSVASKQARTTVILIALLVGALGWLVLRGDEFVPPTGSGGRPDAPTRRRATPPTSAATKPARSDAPAGTLRVTVRGHDRPQVSGALVRVLTVDARLVVAPPGPPPATLAEERADDSGIAELVGLAPDSTVRVVAEAAGFGSASRVVTTPSAGAALDVELLLGSACVLRGRTVDPDGKPVAAAVVQVGDGSVWRTTSDELGSFRLLGLAWGEHAIHAGRPRASPLRVADVVLPLDGELTIVLERPATLTGVVTDAETGAPLPDVEVTAGIWWGMRGGGAAVTDAGGLYVIDTLPGGVANQVSARRAGYRMRPVPTGPRGVQVGLLPGRTTRHDIALLPSRTPSGALADARVHGTVSGPDGPVEGAPVTLQGPGGFRTTRTDSNGAYEFAAVVAGRSIVYVLRAPSGLTDRAYAERGEAPGPSDADVMVEPAQDVLHDIALTRGAAIVGRVVDAAGAPIAGARFALATTDSDGRFRLDGVTPGERIEAYVSAPGHVRAVHSATAPDSGDSAEVVVTLQPVARVRGTITTADGEPPGEARVRVVAHTGRVLPGPGGRPDVRASRPVSPDRSDGRYDAGLEWTSSGEFVVEVSAPGLPTARSDRVQVIPGRGAYEVDVRLDAGVAVRGRVVDGESGEPVPGARIAAGAASIDRVAAVAGPDGRFVVQTIAGPRERIHLHVTAFGFAPKDSSHLIAECGDVALRLARENVLSGRVIRPDGAPLAGVRVAAGSPRGPACVTTADGVFEIRGLAREATTLHVAPASAAGPDIRAAVVRDVAPGTRGLDIVAHPGLRIAGRVTLANGSAVADAIVRAIAPGGAANADDPWARSGGAGRFVIVGLAAGAYDVRAAPNRDSPYAGASVDCHPTTAEGVAAGTADLELILRTGYTIDGVLVDAESRPLGGVWLEAGGRTTRTEHDGRFRLPGLPPGRFQIRPATPGVRGAPAAVSGGESVPAGAVDVRLIASKGDALLGIVVSEDGVGLGGVDVELRAAPRLRRTITTAADGSFHIDGLPAGPYALTARTEQRVPDRLTGISAGDEVRLVLSRSLSSSGRLVDRAGSPIRGRWLDFVINGSDHLTREARTDDDGQFRVDGLADREYRVVALVSVDGEPRRIAAGTLRGGAMDVELRLD